ncbi:MAG TPA: TMEM175 family protein [Baekduia sp.]
MADASPPPTLSAERELDRVGAFSDGVFAIAITLLVLNIEVPHVPGADLGQAIRDLSSSFVAYGIGFAVMGLFWFQHHRLFSRLSRSSGRLVLANTALLASISLMPFTTAVLGRYNEPLAVALYAVDVGIAILLGGVIAQVAVADGLLTPGAPRPDFVRDTLPRAAVFAVSIPIAYGISESLAKWSWLLLLVVPRLTERPAGDRNRV